MFSPFEDNFKFSTNHPLTNITLACPEPSLAYFQHLKLHAHVSVVFVSLTAMSKHRSFGGGGRAYIYIYIYTHKYVYIYMMQIQQIGEVRDKPAPLFLCLCTSWWFLHNFVPRILMVWRCLKYHPLQLFFRTLLLGGKSVTLPTI